MSAQLLAAFPLSLVLLPEEILPLHIFEERYKQMIGECLKAQAQQSEGQEFGIVLAEEGELRPVGCSARILQVVRKYPDGRLDIRVKGRRRFEILYANEEAPYLRCEVDFFGDDGPETPDEAAAAAALQLYRELADRLPQAAEEPLRLQPPYRFLSFRLGAALAFEAAFKQELLTLRQEEARLAKVTLSMQGLLAQLQSSQQAREKARGNGNRSHRVH